MWCISIFTSVFFLAVPTCLIDAQEVRYVRREVPRSFIVKYLASVVPGTLIGGVSGLLCGLTDQHIGFFPLSWLIFPAMRHLLIEEFARDCSLACIPHSKAISSTVAQIADWIVYLCMC